MLTAPVFMKAHMMRTERCDFYWRMALTTTIKAGLIYHDWVHTYHEKSILLF